jgi:hypothetical protein
MNHYNQETKSRTGVSGNSGDGGSLEASLIIVTLLRLVMGVLDRGICSGTSGDTSCLITGDEAAELPMERGPDPVADPPCDRDDPLG